VLLKVASLTGAHCYRQVPKMHGSFYFLFKYYLVFRNEKGRETSYSVAVLSWFSPLCPYYTALADLSMVEQELWCNFVK
jgi:hypothetical protein